MAANRFTRLLCPLLIQLVVKAGLLCPLLIQLVVKAGLLCPLLIQLVVKAGLLCHASIRRMGDVRCLRAGWLVSVVAWSAASCDLCTADSSVEIDYRADVAPILNKYCVGCHNADDREGDLTLESFADLQRGLEEGPLVLPFHPQSSRLVRVLTGETDLSMPPEDSPRPTQQEISLLQAWIAAGALGPEGGETLRKLITPHIAPASTRDASAITALALSPDDRRLAVGRFGRVELLESVLQTSAHVLADLPGKVQAISFSRDAKWLAVATGTAGLEGRADLYDTSDWSLLRSFVGHRDSLYDAEIDPTGRILATCSYDRTIVLWEIASGKRLQTISGHNGAVFDVAFSPDGAVVASASADETVKLWKVATGERLDTLGQPEAEQVCVTFSPDGKQIVAGGADNRIRVWRFESRESQRINPLLFARFAHEGPIVSLKFTPDGRSLISAASDRTLKIWETQEFGASRMLPQQPDVVSAMAVSQSSDRVAVARMDGSWEVYPIAPVERETIGPTAVEPLTDALPSVAQSIAELTEQEPNDTTASALQFGVPALVRGVIAGSATPDRHDVDLVRFTARRGERCLVEVNAARNKSPLDSYVEVLDADGQPVPRVVLRAVRDSYFTFRGKDSKQSGDFRLHNWEEMELNQYLYAGGEVVKLWHYPRGPDSGFLVYPGDGNRYAYFDTTNMSHALNEPCWIVEPLPINATIVPNGLPTFTVFYENDDDSKRAWGTDSRLMFTAPADGDYWVRIGDVRGFGGEDYSYELTIRHPQPSFEVSVEMAQQTILAGSGREFRIVANRKDGFEGEIRVDVAGLPPGFTATSPVVVQQEQVDAYGTIFAHGDATSPGDESSGVRLAATAVIDGVEVRQDVTWTPKLQVGSPPSAVVWIGRVGETSHEPPTSDVPLELTIAPGETISAIVHVKRRDDFDDRVAFGNEGAGRNLPHGVYVDNIGLNGLMVTQGISEREFFITAADWVPETSRLFHLKAQIDDDVTSLPVLIKVVAPQKLAQRRNGL